MPELSSISLGSDPNLRFYWKLENTTATTGGATLTNTNSVAFNAAKFGLGADFGATNTNKLLSTASVTANTNSFGSAFTMSVWMKVNTEIPASGIYNFFYLGSTSTNISYNLSYEFFGSRKLHANRRRETIANYDLYAGATLGASGFFHIAFTFDGGTGLATIYLEGASIGASVMDPGNGSAGNETDGMILGRSRTFENTNYSPVILDDLALFDRVLDAAEIAAIAGSHPSVNYLKFYRRTRFPGSITGVG